MGRSSPAANRFAVPVGSTAIDPSATTKLTSAGGTGTKYAAGVVATLQTINAHQNTSYTLCPGQYLFPLMATIRSKATAYAKTSCPAPTAGHHREAVRRRTARSPWPPAHRMGGP